MGNLRSKGRAELLVWVAESTRVGKACVWWHDLGHPADGAKLRLAALGARERYKMTSVEDNLELGCIGIPDDEYYGTKEPRCIPFPDSIHPIHNVAHLSSGVTNAPANQLGITLVNTADRVTDTCPEVAPGGGCDIVGYIDGHGEGI